MSDDKHPACEGPLQPPTPTGPDCAPVPNNDWKDQVITELVVLGILSPVHENDPRKALQDIILHSTRNALDPLVSEQARQLVEQGRQQALAELGPHLTAKGVKEALKAAVSALYFDDGSDFGPALYQVVSALRPDKKEELTSGDYEAVIRQLYNELKEA